MTVVVENVKGQAAKLDKLADKINAEHRAYVAAVSGALAHAIEAGRLLEEVKQALPHTEWGPWVKEHFAGSDRTERDYRRVWRNREKLKQNGSTAATLSLRQALKALAEPKPKPAPLWQRNLPFDPADQPGPTPAVAEALEAEQAAIDAQKQRNREALAELRAAERLTELCDIIKVLDQLVPKYPPEEAGAALAAWTSGGRGLTVLRDSISWLQQVLDAAEQERERMQNPE